MDFIHITVIDVIDIVVVALLMYYLYKVMRGTRAPAILSGIILIYLLWVIVRALNMELLSTILGHFIGVGLIALIVVFQPEIRRFLQMIGTRGNLRRETFLRKLFVEKSDEGQQAFIDPIVAACGDMSASRTGALIVIHHYSNLDMIAETGVELDAKISASLLKNIFFKNSPLHDGAIVVNEDRIVAAKCVLPSTESEVPLSFGMRHRAALGISEVTDAIVVVVSEETGKISIAHRGHIRSNLSPTELKAELMKLADAPAEEENHPEESTRHV